MTLEALIFSFASVVFLITLFFVLLEKIHRMIAAMVGAMVMIVGGMAFGFYDEHLAIEAIDFETIGLLLGMMLMVALLEPTGFFEYLAIWAGRWSRGRPVRLLVLLGTITTVVSMFLDNVTTVVLIAPVTVLITEILGLNPVPLLIAEALLSNTGGVATLVGDPPNVIIGSAAGLTFVDFLVNSLPIVLVAWLTALFLLWALFRRELSVAPRNLRAIDELDPDEALHNPDEVRKVLTVLAVAIAAFFMQRALHATPALIALSAASVAFLWVRPDVHEILQKIEWNVLLFFAALFIVVGGLEAAGVLAALTQVISQASAHISPLAFGILLIWVVAGLSAVVDNIPITIALVPVLLGLGESGYNVNPLWWALAFGAGFGGNGTIIGSTANIIVVSISERTSHPITARRWMKTGLPVMVATCAVASVLYAVALRYFPWFSR